MSQTDNKEKRTLREDWMIFLRGIRIWNKLIPRYGIYSFLWVLVRAFSPYFGLYMSAQLVNELSGECESERLVMLALAAAGGGFLLSVTVRFLSGRRELARAYYAVMHEEYLFMAQNGFQYSHLENPDVALERTKIIMDADAIGGGLFLFIWEGPKILEDILNIFFSVSLTVSMFTLRADGEYTGFLGFINSPASAVVIVAMIAANAVIATKIATTRTTKQWEAMGEMARLNTHADIYGDLWGPDMILFDLNRIVIEEYEKIQLQPEWFKRKEKVTIKYNSCQIVLDAVLSIAVILFAAVKAFIGVFGIGSFILYQGAIGSFINAVSGLAVTVGKFRDNNRYLLKLYDFLDLPNEMYQGTLAVEKRDDIDYEIEFKDVSFKYPRTDAWALRHVNMKFKIGDKLAIVGENGSGKTTFIKLLCRLYDPTEGKILLNGIDITRYRYEEYMALFSVVFQDFTLFGFPLGDNVASTMKYDEKKVRDCLIRAGMGEKLAELDRDAEEKGKALDRSLDSKYASDSIDLSGGERQKVALARALYKDAPFVILDEPTAALDPIAEAAVYENFNKIAQNKTSVFISHRLSSCRFCDTIAVFDHGRLIQQGSHDVLVADGEGKYNQLWEAQAKYYNAQSN